MELIAISVYGLDRKGIVKNISGVLAENNVNIVDIEQSVLQGVFTMFLIADVSRCRIDLDELITQLKESGREVGVNVDVSPFKRPETKKKNLYIVTVLGEDKVGIVHRISSFFYEMGINIERTNLTARDKLIAIDFVVDLDDEGAKKKIKEFIEGIGMDVVIRPYREEKSKRLIVFDMDSTIVDAEIIDELAKVAGVEEEVKRLTAKAMEGELDFKSALKERVKLLKGLPVEVLEKIYNEIKLTDGAKELIKSLKESGYVVAVVSGGFSYFTDRLKEELGLDYAFGNELEIENGRLTGRLKGRIIDAVEKARIIEEIAKKEGIAKENIVAVGDGANDKIMIENAGLGIAFNAKKALKEVADGSISKENLIGIASVLKLKNEFKKRF
ncbi:phosphoserine phosphatase [Archaeoglobus sulfaticallidus PM70-1]|uniref:phosphoserine phosphatase n=1 Tax=Archaeoglobus sulfaticallidus PM70-1 TaxID=387631 RepID=N0B9U5_9EURY|nr:phosphoserine phosphatase SerB [Archaeoglobus sulfaticallidus]AGK60364.1 phosphoserine phosphatase [Archaeoglobus sulfaticallidus PM70-1]